MRRVEVLGRAQDRGIQIKSGRLVAAMMGMTPSFDSKPSISTTRSLVSRRLLALVVSAAEACAFHDGGPTASDLVEWKMMHGSRAFLP